MDCSTPGLPVHHQLPEFTHTHDSHRVVDAIQPSHPLLSPSPPAFHLSQHQDLFKWVSSLHQVAKVLELIPYSEYPELISFRMDWLDLLAVQDTLKSLLHHHSSKASILHHSAFFIVYLSHPYMTPGKTIALTRQTFVGKVMSLLFNMLSRLCNTLSNPYCSNLPESCSYEGRVFQDGEDWPLSRCAKCVCRNGVAQCFASQCPPLFCSQVRKTASERPFTDCWLHYLGTWSLFWDDGRQASQVLKTRSKSCFIFLIVMETTPETFLFPLTATDRPNYQSFKLIVT